MQIFNAKDSTKQMHFIFGEAGSGRSTHAIKLTEGRKALWVAFNNIAALSDQDVAMPTAEEFLEFVAEALAGKHSQYDTIVVDGGLEALLAHYLPEEDVTQKNWAEMARKVHRTMVQLRSSFDCVVVIADVKRDDEDNLSLVINPDLYRKVIGLFDNTHYCYLRGQRDAKGNVVAEFVVQDFKADALRFKRERN